MQWLGAVGLFVAALAFVHYVRGLQERIEGLEQRLKTLETVAVRHPSTGP